MSYPAPGYNNSNRAHFSQGPQPAGNVPYGYSQQPQQGYNQPQQNYSQSRPSQNQVNPAPLANSYYQHEHEPQQIYQEDAQKARNLIYADEHPALEHSKKERVINWVTYICPILYLVIALYVASHLLYLRQHKLERPEEALGTVDFVVKNLKLDPIVDIQSINLPAPPAPAGAAPAKTNTNGHFHHNSHFEFHHSDAPTCQKDYEFAVLGEWSGVNSGCLCDDGTVHSHAYCLVTGSRCKFVRAKDPMGYSQWKQQRVCVLKLKNYRWVGTGKCTDKENLCQPGLCVDKAQKCPVNQLEVQTNNNNGNAFFQFDGKTYKANIVKDTQPIVGFSVIPGNSEQAPCYNDNVAPAFQSKKFYPLERVPESGCEAQADPYTTQLSSQPVQDAYNQNSFKETLDSIPYYSTYIQPTDTLNIGVIQRVKIGLDQACDTLNPSKLETLQNKATQLHSVYKGVTIFVIIAGGIGLLAAIILFVLKGRHLDTCHMNEVSQTRIIYAFAVVVAILFVALGALYLANVNKSGGLKDLHDELTVQLQKGCFVDEPIKAKVEELDKFSVDTYTSSKYLVLVTFGISIAFLIITIILAGTQQALFHEPWCIDPWK